MGSLHVSIRLDACCPQVKEYPDQLQLIGLTIPAWIMWEFGWKVAAMYLSVYPEGLGLESGWVHYLPIVMSVAVGSI